VPLDPVGTQLSKVLRTKCGVRQWIPGAKTIVLVQDNLNTHTPASLYEAFPAPEARRLAERFEWQLA
jgi:hypothetical protein